MRGFNDDELLDFVELTKTSNLTIRFIELMPFDAHQIWKTGKFYKSEDIVRDLKNQVKGLQPVTGSNTEHYIFKVDGYLGHYHDENNVFMTKVGEKQEMNFDDNP